MDTLFFGPNGEMARNRSTIGTNSLTTVSISSSVIYRLKLNQMEPCAWVKGNPIDRRTWEGSNEPDVQAEPEDAPIPFGEYNLWPESESISIGSNLSISS